jgi:hypothetical protein
MKRVLITAMALACATVFGVSADAFAQSSPPGNVSPKDATSDATSDTTSGKAAGYSGGAGAAGQSGTDPKTLSRTEEERVRKQNGGASGAAGANQGKRKDWKE